MFIAVEGPPMILRLYGTGRIILSGSKEWQEKIGHFQLLPGARQIVSVSVESVKTSCGYSVPFFTYEGERSTLKLWAEKQDVEKLAAYHKEKNTFSMDGLITPMGREAQS